MSTSHFQNDLVLPYTDQTYLGFTSLSTPRVVLEIPVSYDVMILRMDSGTVTISLKDGSVKFTDCTPDEGAKIFWEAVTLAFPSVATAITKRNT